MKKSSDFSENLQSKLRGLMRHPDMAVSSSVGKMEGTPYISYFLVNRKDKLAQENLSLGSDPSGYPVVVVERGTDKLRDRAVPNAFFFMTLQHSAMKWDGQEVPTINFELKLAQLMGKKENRQWLSIMSWLADRVTETGAIGDRAFLTNLMVYGPEGYMPLRNFLVDSQGLVGYQPQFTQVMATLAIRSRGRWYTMALGTYVENVTHAKEAAL